MSEASNGNGNPSPPTAASHQAILGGRNRPDPCAAVRLTAISGKRTSSPRPVKANWDALATEIVPWLAQ